MDHKNVSLMQELLKCGTNIPLWHYDADGHLLETSEEHLVLDKIFSFIGGTRDMLDYARTGRKPFVIQGDMGLMWCAVFQSDKDNLKSIYVIGPVFNAEVSHSFLDDSVERYHIDDTFRKQFISIMKRISVVPSLMFQQYCLMLHFCINNEHLNRSDIQFRQRNEPSAPLSAGPEYNRTRIYQTEQALLRLVREGDIQYKQAVSEARHLFDATFHRDPLQSAIIHAAAFTTLCIREAIAAGISTDTAYVIGDGYIGSMAQSKTFSDLTSLTLAMFEDFIYRVRKHRTNPNVSAQIRSCRDYIELHAEQELKLPELAKQAGYSEYYLSRKFKQEMGLSISTYIKYVRVERGKMMLVNSSIPIAQIADTLRFASSSHFSDSFREIVGKTPQQYRLDNQHF